MFQHFSKYLQRKPGGPAVDFSGIWVNELSSEMDLTVHEGRVSGTYRTAVGRANPTERFELVGFVSGDRIVFCVNFGAYGTLAAWAGLHSEDKGVEEIYSLWHLPREIQDDEEAKEYRWSAILTGVNTFKRKRAS
ncbi:MAG TPA: avidin/streptavidin family protein [Nitrospiraceae bacterium]|nr:avidin/streptavidin family protein [Nitrospiraceae bacterium]